MIELYRYPQTLIITSARDPVADLVVHLGYFRVLSYTTELLATLHGVSNTDAKARSPRIRAHAEMALAYLEQAFGHDGPASFLTGYYGILNLLKLYILFSSHHAALPANRYHGVTYDVYSKNSQSLLTEEITVRERGVLQLVYQVITGLRMRADMKVRMAEVYPLIADVGLEWEMASGHSSRLAQLSGDVQNTASSRHLHIKAHAMGQLSIQSPRMLKVLKSFRSRGPSGEFVGPGIYHATASDEEIVDASLRRYLLYHDPSGNPFTAVSSAHLHIPEELPLTLAFFHLSSVVRYKPDFVQRLRDSRYWPVLAALRWHGLYKALVLTWSFLYRKTPLFHGPLIQ